MLGAAHGGPFIRLPAVEVPVMRSSVIASLSRVLIPGLVVLFGATACQSTPSITKGPQGAHVPASAGGPQRPANPAASAAVASAAVASAPAAPAAAASAAVAASQAVATPTAPPSEPVAAPTGLALAGRDGRDAYGYPTRYVDKAALRGLLEARRFAELTRSFEAFQVRFEADHRYEYWPTDASDAFGSGEPGLLPLLNAWVAATPASFAPHLARGSYWQMVGNRRRGVKWAADTSEGEFAGMHDANVLAHRDLARALELRPKLVAAYRVQMILLYGDADARMRRTRDAALAICPECFCIRCQYIMTQVPRWGGSYAAMAAYARESERLPNRKLRLLKGLIDQDQANMLHLNRRYAEALTVINRACALGDYSKFLLQRAQTYRRLNRLDEALKDLDRGLAVRPTDELLTFERAKVHSLAGHCELAASDLAAGLRLDPENPFGRATRDIVVPALAREAAEARLAGRRADADRLRTLMAQLER
jgi:tetratricopeptide (TPR) repeat protein